MFLDDGDVCSRKTTYKARETATKTASCLVRVKTGSGKSRSSSVSLDGGNADLFQKRVNQLIKMQMLRTKPRKVRTGSQ